MSYSLTPFFDTIAALQKQKPRFFVPGHKGHPDAIPPFSSLLAWDFTEIEGACDLSNPSGALLQSQENMAKAYNSAATLYSVSGTTNCIMAMLATFCPPGSVVAISRGVHVSAVRALVLLDLIPAWIPLQNGRPNPDTVKNVLKKSNAKAVFITGTDYHGRSANISAISAICREENTVLLCDNAHGAHLNFIKPNKHPLHLGADAVCDSAHKTLPVLTPGSLLHLRTLDKAQAARKMLNMFSSTSPSYPVLLSLDLCAGRLLSDNVPDFSGAALSLAKIASAFSDIVVSCDDCLRLVIAPSILGYPSQLFYDTLVEHGLHAEFFDGQRIVFMVSPFNSAEDFAFLKNTILNTMHTLSSCKSSSFNLTSFTSDEYFEEGFLPKQTSSPRLAFFADKINLSIDKCIGKTAADLSVSCPPGVPIIIPGEEISPYVAKALLSCGISSFDVVK